MLLRPYWFGARILAVTSNCWMLKLGVVTYSKVNILSPMMNFRSLPVAIRAPRLTVSLFWRTITALAAAEKKRTPAGMMSASVL